MFQLFSRELRRKAIHTMGSLIPVGYYFVSKETALILLSPVNGVLLLIEWLRIHGTVKFPEILLRPHEEKKVAAYIYFLMASLFSILVFDKTIAIAALLMLALGDTASGLAGALIKGGDVRHNDTKNKVKPFSIMALMFSICVMIGHFLSVLPPAPGMAHLSFGVYVSGALGATLGDAVPVRIIGKPVDDNLIIPLLSGTFMTVADFI